MAASGGQKPQRQRERDNWGRQASRQARCRYGLRDGEDKVRKGGVGEKRHHMRHVRIKGDVISFKITVIFVAQVFP